MKDLLAQTYYEELAAAKSAAERRRLEKDGVPETSVWGYAAFLKNGARKQEYEALEAEYEVPPPTAAAPPPAPTNQAEILLALTKMSKTELIQLCKDKHIKCSGKTKPELIAMLSA